MCCFDVNSEKLYKGAEAVEERHRHRYEVTMGDFTVWISLSLSLSLRPVFRLRPNIIQKVKWRFWFRVSQSLSENFRWAFRWVRTLDSAI